MQKSNESIEPANAMKGTMPMNEMKNEAEPINTKKGEMIMNEVSDPNDEKSVQDVPTTAMVAPANPEGEMPMQADGSTSTPRHFTVKWLDITVIKKRDAFRTREKENEANIEGLRVAFIENMIAERHGHKPPHQIPLIVVLYDRRTMEHVLLGGFHRLEGATRAGLTKIQVRVFHGTEAEAFQVAIEDNNSHGLKLSRGDKRYTIEKMLLRDPDKPYREIARELKCVVSYVSTIANKLLNAGLLEGKRMRKERGVNAKPRKSISKQMVKTVERIDSLLVGMSMKDGTELLGELFKRYSRLNRYIKEQALKNGNDAVIAMDQIVEATRT